MTMRILRRASIAACAIAAAGSAFAQQTDNGASAPAASEIGHATLGWLELQRSGAVAAPPLATLGEEATLAYNRYMESFKTKIPASFGSSVNQGGNQLHVDYTNSGGSAQN